ncbi:hypothetical protein Syun_028570 [Stephania yunnanensis]|uniref:ABC1 atypical kinase-like domain-containing protein n=1 Tax=Stephania yunnanensis TaxID=152371 RepID=A0AAP0HJ15_9MAGN
MVWFQEVSRLLNGASLVAKEIAKRSEVLQNVRNGDVEALLNKALVSATDFAGFTKGQIRALSQPPPTSKGPTLVYFHESAAHSTKSDQPLERGAGGGGGGGEFHEKLAQSPADRLKLVALHENGNQTYGDGSGSSIGTTTTDGSSSSSSSREDVPPPEKQKMRRRRERRVPSTPFSRALGFAGLGAGLAWGTLQESARRLVYGAPKSKPNASAVSPFLSEQNAERLALALCRMRGAALKLGQMLSIQDESLVPAPILAALDIVRQGADVMPMSQLNQVLDAELGPEWKSKLQSFDYEPMAAASIGQVHRAVTKDGREVAMKIQYPGVADSIESDIENVKLLLDYTNLIPEGLFLDRAMKVAKEELSRECDYELEAKNQKRFRDLLSENKEFYVPMVIENISSKRVLTTELVSGVPIDKVATMNQETRNYVGKKLLELTLMELFVFRFMQTDPNWSNFLYDEASKMINLIDFGAARDYPKRFVDNYLKMVIACANCERDGVIEMSRRLGFLTGKESEIMLEAHVQAGFVVGLPFAKAGGYDFGSSNITQSVSNLGATMLRHRLTPPPDEVYSLHRKLSGAFLACIKLGAVVPCREMLLQMYEQYEFGNEDDEALSAGSMA